MRRPLFVVSLFVMFCLTLYLALSPDGGAEPPDQSYLLLYGQVIERDEDSFVIRLCRISQEKDSDLPSDKIIQMNAAALRQENQTLQFYNGFYKKIRCEWDNVSAPVLGCHIWVTGKFRAYQRAGNPGEFDYASYYHSMDYGGSLQHVQILRQEDTSPGVREGLYRLRQFWERRLYEVFPQKEASVMTAMLLGDKSDLDADLKTLYRKTGVIHILSISGLHITLIGVGLYNRLRKLGVPMWLAAFAGGVLLVLYGMLTGFGISACRAIGMYLIRMLSHMAGRTYDMLTALGVVGAVMVCVHPTWVGHMGFLLSFTSVLGVAALGPCLQERLASWRETAGNNKLRRQACYVEESWKRRIFKVQQQGIALLQQSFVAGVSVTLTTLPIQLWFSYEISAYSLFLNLLVLPLMGVVLATGLAAMLIPGLGIVGTVDLLILALYEKLCLFFEKLPRAIWNPGRPRVWQIVVYYLLWAAAVWGLPFLRRKAKKLYQRRFLATMLLLGGAVGMLCLPRMRVNRMTFLDVGQGDGMCLQLASGEVYLFDCGSSNRQKIGEKVLLPFLKYYGISEIDAVFLSHGDADHVNGVLELLGLAQEEHLTIRQVVLPEIPDDVSEKEFQEVKNVIRQMKKPPVVTAIRKGIGWQSSKSQDMAVDFLCLHPAGLIDTERGSIPESEQGSDTDGNAFSECFCITFPTDAVKSGRRPVRILLTGDVEGTGEQELIETLKKYGISDIDILKCPHHGSRGSTGMELLSGITPTVTVISCGKNNRYGHPHEELLDRLEAVHSTVYQTDRTGAVTVSIKRDGYRIETFW